MFFPLVLAALGDILVALSRVGTFLSAEELEEPHKIDHGSKYAVQVDGDFTWETAGKMEGSKFHTAGGRGKGNKDGKKAGGNSKGETNPGKTAKKTKEEPSILPTTNADTVVKEGSVRSGETEETKKEPEEEEKPFELKGLKLTIPRGSFVGIVGACSILFQAHGAGD